jgi:hypothetical protein
MWHHAYVYKRIKQFVGKVRKCKEKRGHEKMYMELYIKRGVSHIAKQINWFTDRQTDTEMDGCRE